MNGERIEAAEWMELPALAFMELHVLVEYYHKDGFLGDAGVSYFIKTDRGSLLFDIGYGEKHPALGCNVKQSGIVLSEVDGLVISHLHPDHMGGMGASKKKRVALPARLGIPAATPCFVPQEATAEGLETSLVTRPQMLGAGVGTTGPLARSLFFFGYTEEQVLIAKLEDRGIVVITGCGHPGVEVILKMVRRLTDLPIYALVGGLHFPLTKSRHVKGGIQLQMLFGTGKPPWQRINDGELTQAIALINDAEIKKVLISAHDSCDHALSRMKEELVGDTTVLEAGETYTL